MKVLLIGATGATGSFLLNHLLNDERIDEVVVFSRKSVLNEHLKLKEYLIDFDKMDQWAKFMYGDVAISCLGTTMKQAGSKEKQWVIDFDYQYHFAEICSKNEVKHFMLLSSMNADENSRIFYSKMKGKLERNVKHLTFDRLDVVQPGMLIRPNSDRMGENIGVKIVCSLNSLGLLQSYRPLHVDDLGWILKELIFANKKGTQIVSLSELLAMLQKK